MANFAYVADGRDCFLVTIPRNRSGIVEFANVYCTSPSIASKEYSYEIEKCAWLSQEKWSAIADDVHHVFSQRLKQLGLKQAGDWVKSANTLDRLLGKELLTLVWAIECDDVTPEEIAVAVRNWRELRPPERWWLCTMAGAQTRGAEYKGLGWRAAIRHGLCYDKPASTSFFALDSGRLPPRDNTGRKAA